MRTEDFNAFLAEVRGRGFSHVLTSAGAVPLDDWKPYGTLAETIPAFRWVGPVMVSDYDEVTRPGVDGGMWRFLTEREAARIAEAERETKRGRR